MRKEVKDRIFILSLTACIAVAVVAAAGMLIMTTYGNVVLRAEQQKVVDRLNEPREKLGSDRERQGAEELGPETVLSNEPTFVSQGKEGGQLDESEASRGDDFYIATYDDPILIMREGEEVRGKLSLIDGRIYFMSDDWNERLAPGVELEGPQRRRLAEERLASIVDLWKGKGPSR
jgi:hypothetical protein